MNDRAPTAILGFRPHTYWTAAVALAGPASAPRVLERRRIEFAAPEARFVYHRAAEGALAEAPGLIAAVGRATEEQAARELAALVAELRRGGIEVGVACVPSGTARLPDALEDILCAHNRIHAAEGIFYREVLAGACESIGLEVRRLVERELPFLACDLLEITPETLRARLREMGAALGPPWSEDYRLATLAAWLQLEAEDAGA